MKQIKLSKSLLVLTLLAFSKWSQAAIDLKINYDSHRNYQGLFGKSWCSILDKTIEITDTEILMFDCESQLPFRIQKTKGPPRYPLIIIKDRIQYVFDEYERLSEIRNSNQTHYQISYDEFDRPKVIKEIQTDIFKVIPENKITIQYDELSGNVLKIK